MSVFLEVLLNYFIFIDANLIGRCQSMCWSIFSVFESYSAVSDKLWIWRIQRDVRAANPVESIFAACFEHQMLRTCLFGITQCILVPIYNYEAKWWHFSHSSGVFLIFLILSQSSYLVAQVTHLGGVPVLVQHSVFSRQHNQMYKVAPRFLCQQRNQLQMISFSSLDYLTS